MSGPLLCALSVLALGIRFRFGFGLGAWVWNLGRRLRGSLVLMVLFFDKGLSWTWYSE